jgi:hypothetical protein
MLGGKGEETIRFIVTTYNEISKEPVGREWMENLRARQILWFEEYGDRETIQLKNEFRKVA